MTFRGLTWDHPRGFDALAEAARRVNAGRDTPLIQWEKQPLEGFESAPVADLAAGYDLLVLDHPHIGEAVASDCLTPLEDIFTAAQIAGWARDSIGPAFRSYRWQGRTWALPLDVATQVMARRPDRIATPPESWDEMLDLGRRLPVALSLAGPHAMLTLISLAASCGDWPRGEAFLPDAAALAALDLMHRLHALRPVGSEALNPIALSQAMASGDDIALVPLIFGYSTYAVGRPGRHPLSFSDTLREPGGAGGVLGGTGIAFSHRCRPTPDLLAHVGWLMRPDTQSRFIPAHGGQPSARSAWADAGVNAAAGGFYRLTSATAETALLRPRFDGYIAFQSRASEVVRQALATRAEDTDTLCNLRTLWRAARAAARGPLDDERGPTDD